MGKDDRVFSHFGWAAAKPSRPFGSLALFLYPPSAPPALTGGRPARPAAVPKQGGSQENRGARREEAPLSRGVPLKLSIPTLRTPGLEGWGVWGFGGFISAQTKEHPHSKRHSHTHLSLSRPRWVQNAAVLYNQPL